jgi:hypothetical protein
MDMVKETIKTKDDQLLLMHSNLLASAVVTNKNRSILKLRFNWGKISLSLTFFVFVCLFVG